ncbi:hypothetical protein CF326_g1448 [Tilletia indica]|nr:hypothetical protein CF326_g1448 [Tilletia indica]
MDIDRIPAGAGAAESSAAPTPSGVSAAHVWSSASTAYEALALFQAALLQQQQQHSAGPSDSSESKGEGSSSKTLSESPALTRASFAALLATLHTAAVGYHAHIIPHTSERHERLLHERSRLHLSRVQMTHTLARGLGLPLRGSREPVAQAAPSAPSTAASMQSAARQPLPRALTEQLYSALVQLHPSRPAVPQPLSSTKPSIRLKKSPSPTAGNDSTPVAITLPALGPSPRTSPALATLALNTLSNIISNPARSLFALEVFAEHFELDRGGSATGGAGGGVVGSAGVTSPSVAVSPAVLPPETADGGRAVSVIMLGGTVLVVDIELGVKEWVPPPSPAGNTEGGATDAFSRVEGVSASIPAWARQTGHLSWLPTVHVKITFANDTSANPETNAQAMNDEHSNTQANGTSTSAAGTSITEGLASSLQRHLLVMAQILLLGFPLSLELEDDAGNGESAQVAPTDGDVSMQDVSQSQQAQQMSSETASVPAQVTDSQQYSSFPQHESYANALRTALRPRPPPETLDPGLRLVHTDLYGEEYYLLAHHHLRAFVLVLGRLAQLDRERSGGASTS